MGWPGMAATPSPPVPPQKPAPPKPSLAFQPYLLDLMVKLPNRQGHEVQTLPTIETRYKLYAFCDDLKSAIKRMWEFLLYSTVILQLYSYITVQLLYSVQLLYIV